MNDKENRERVNTEHKKRSSISLVRAHVCVCVCYHCHLMNAKKQAKYLRLSHRSHMHVNSVYVFS